jgi:EpsG family
VFDKLLHPAFTLLLLFLIVMAMAEAARDKKIKMGTIITFVSLLILGGFRYRVGADGNTYVDMFFGFEQFTTYGDVFAKAIFIKSKEETEWLYVLVNKLISDAGLEFYMVTFVMMLGALSLKISTIWKNLPYPALGLMFYFIPQFFFEDGGQMRQGMAIAICVFSFKYIKERNLKMFLLMMYLSAGFHKTGLVFLPAYWIVLIPMNSTRIAVAIGLSMLLSPFKVYEIAGPLLDFLAPQDLSDGFGVYINDSMYGASMSFGLGDVSKIIFIILLIVFNKPAQAKVPYYEYMRNLAIFGLCLYYILRGNTIFAVRLTGVYLFFLTVFSLPAILASQKNIGKSLLSLAYTVYIILLYFNYTMLQGDYNRYTVPLYKNVLWDQEVIDWHNDWCMGL